MIFDPLFEKSATEPNRWRNTGNVILATLKDKFLNNKLATQAYNICSRAQYRYYMRVIT